MTDAIHLDLRREFPAIPHGREVLNSAFTDAAHIEADISVSEWADEHRMVSEESGSPFPGKWRTDRVPYLREPMDCLHPDHPARRASLKFSAQTGKSEVGVNWFCFIVDKAPASTLTVLPTGEEAKKYNRVKLQPTIDASPRVRHRVRPENSRDEDGSTTAFKRFAGGFNQITTASSSKGLQMVSVRWLILDEVSGYPRDADSRGAPSEQARARQKAWGDLAKELALSTPGMVGECEISELYDAGDRRRLYVPCPDCGTYHVLKYENMQPPSESTRWRVTFACPMHGCLIDQVSMNDMRARAHWVATRVHEGDDPIPDLIPADAILTFVVAPCTGRVVQWQPSWALWSAYSPMESWSDIWDRGQKALGDPIRMRTFVQQDLGEPYEPKTDVPAWEKLLEVRKSWVRGVVPYPACVLTGFIDVQGNRFEWGLWGWGPGFQGWLVDRGVINHDYTTDAAWAAIDALTTRAWPVEGGRDLAVMTWGIDTGAFTQALYDRVGSRYNLLATKGDNRPRAAPLKKGRADLKDEQGRKIAGRRLDLALIGNFDLKLSVYEGLRALVAGPQANGVYRPSTLHLPDWIGEDELKQMTAEVLVDPREDIQGKKGRSKLLASRDTREWRKRAHQPNEGLDIVVGSRALAWGEGAGQLTQHEWQKLVSQVHCDANAAEPDLFSQPLVTETPTTAPEDNDPFAALAELNADF